MAYTLDPLHRRLNLLDEWTLLYLRAKCRDRKKSRFMNLSFLRGKSLILEDHHPSWKQLLKNCGKSKVEPKCREQ